MNTMPSKRDPAHALYETYFLMNFVQLPPEKQLEHFYLRRIVPVPPEAHYQAVTLDTHYNHLIINPLYQLFFCIGLYSFELFPLLVHLYGISGERYERCDRWQPRLFSERFQAAFLSHLTENTSREGFCHGADWQSLRRRLPHFSANGRFAGKPMANRLSPAAEIERILVSRRFCPL